MSVNKWLGIGNLTKDPETRFTSSGTQVCNFSIACNEKFKDKEGNWQEKVEYINIVAWKNLAKICSDYLKKGKQVFVSGRLQTRSYDDRDGNKRYITEIVADQMQMLGTSGSVSRENADIPNTTEQDAPYKTDDELDIPF